MAEQVPATSQRHEIAASEARCAALVAGMQHTPIDTVVGAYEHVIALFDKERARVHRNLGEHFDTSYEQQKFEFEQALGVLSDADPERAHALCASLSVSLNPEIRAGAVGMLPGLTRADRARTLPYWERLMRDQHVEPWNRIGRVLAEVTEAPDELDRREAAARLGLTLSDVEWIRSLRDAERYDPRAVAFRQLMAASGGLVLRPEQ